MYKLTTAFLVLAMIIQACLHTATYNLQQESIDQYRDLYSSVQDEYMELSRACEEHVLELEQELVWQENEHGQLKNEH